MKVIIVKEVKRSDGLWRFACGDVFNWDWLHIIDATSNVLNINQKIVMCTLTLNVFISSQIPHLHLFSCFYSYFSSIWKQECNTEQCELVWSQCAECFPMCGKSQDHFIMPAARLNEQKNCDWIIRLTFLQTKISVIGNYPVECNGTWTGIAITFSEEFFLLLVKRSMVRRIMGGCRCGESHQYLIFKI